MAPISCTATLRRFAALPSLPAVTVALTVAAAALTAHAQATARPGRPDPLDPKARVPALAYRSSLTMHKPTAEDKPVSWREANDNVARIGGWRVYAREAQLPEPAPAAAAGTSAPVPIRPAAAEPTPAPTQRPPAMPHGHSGHKLP